MLFMNVVLFMLSVFLSTHGYEILAVFPHEGKSHQFVFAPIIRRLVEEGHRLSVIVHYSFGIKSERYTEILLNDPHNSGKDFFEVDEMEGYESMKLIQLLSIDSLFQEGLHSCYELLNNRDVRSLIETNKKFDLIIAEIFNSECAQGFVGKFEVPLVGISTTTILPWHNDPLANSDNPSYIPNNHLWHSSKMTFFERLENLLGVLWMKSLYFSYLEDNEKLLKDSFKMTTLRLTRNIDVLLVNSHYSLSNSRPLVPSIVEIGGIHITGPKKLPENIEKFINESTHGVIYFSLGSMIKGHTFPQEKREEFLRAFARLPQRVLWKWENETMPGKPDNVMIQKWMPQFDILSHPNVKAFISHGGLLGVTEAVHCGVPMMVMPQYGDQHTNAKAVEANGGGVILYLKDATEEKVYENLKTILSPEFKAKASALSERFRDRPMSPMDTAIYWVEYVARHKGAPHLKTAAVDMPLYQYLLLDVLAFLAAIILVVLYISYKITCLIFRALFSKKKVKQN